MRKFLDLLKSANSALAKRNMSGNFFQVALHRIPITPDFNNDLDRTPPGIYVECSGEESAQLEAKALASHRELLDRFRPCILTVCQRLLEPSSSRLLIVTVVLRCALIRRCEEAEKTVRLVADAGGEEQPITRSSPLVVAKA
jgi:hypothetical protein